MDAGPGRAPAAGSLQRSPSLLRARARCWRLPVRPRLTLASRHRALGLRRVAVSAHRGAAAYLPEHTVAAFECAPAARRASAAAICGGAHGAQAGGAARGRLPRALTADGAFVSTNRPTVSESTNADALFPELRVARYHPPWRRNVTGVFVSDLKLEEFRAPRARQPVAGRSDRFDGLLPLAALDDVAAAAAAAAARRGRPVGLFPELKPVPDPAALPAAEAALLSELRRLGLPSESVPVLLQSTDPAQLCRFYNATAGWPLRPAGVLFLKEEDPAAPARLADPAALAALRPCAHALGLRKASKPVPPPRPSAWAPPLWRLLRALGLRGGPEGGWILRAARAAGLRVHGYSYRPEPASAHAAYAGDPEAELREHVGAGLDGVLAEAPDAAIRARAALRLD
eukprot:tig00000545_g1993.t1